MFNKEKSPKRYTMPINGCKEEFEHYRKMRCSSTRISARNLDPKIFKAKKQYYGL